MPKYIVISNESNYTLTESWNDAEYLHTANKEVLGIIAAKSAKEAYKKAIKDATYGFHKNITVYKIESITTGEEITNGNNYVYFGYEHNWEKNCTVIPAVDILSYDAYNFFNQGAFIADLPPISIDMTGVAIKDIPEFYTILFKNWKNSWNSKIEQSYVGNSLSPFPDISLINVTPEQDRVIKECKLMEAL